MARSKRKKPEEILSEQIRNELILKYGSTPYRFDLIADMPLPPALRIKLGRWHGKWSKGYPDLFVASCRGGFGGLYLELKATETVPNTEHTRNQEMYHSVLRKQGYKCVFCCGFKDCKKKLKKYMKLKKNV